ncbi:site-specific DNA-methyltransferase [Capnocytophaga leadbetteri]|uniref:DNA-methyltransferase n=1 Tax=Capnocytophaga leadbetteri TaxID=327575 RepID=UPI0028E7AB5C|nr:site-specific DNA-methyltransferase [Capnocytophaga leadbetteri]
MNNLQLYNADNLEVMATLADESIDVICIDPPYLYLKNQKLDRPFNEPKFFAECKRLLTKKGFIVMFGRGTSFYRWNTILDGLGFVFKEEVIWDKSMGTSPLSTMNRIHETISILTRGGIINKVKVPYTEMKGHDIDSIVKDISKIKSALKNTEKLKYLQDFLDNKRSDWYLNTRFTKHSVTTDIRNSGDRAVNVLASICNGFNEKTIIKQVRDHYNTIHPTQKPVRLLERLLALVIPKDKPRNEVVVADFFAGSMSCMEAVHNMGMRGIATEIDEEYFEKGKQRIESLQPLIINH